MATEENKDAVTEEEETTKGGQEETEDAQETKEETKEPESPFYETKLPNRVVLTRGLRARPPLNFYVERAKRILRSDDTMTVCGVGQGMVGACTLVEILKRQDIAKVDKLCSKMNVNPNFRSGGGLDWGRPVPCIEFIISRGKNALFVTDYNQRKVIEIFEKYDKEMTGKLSVDTIKSLKLGEAFHATEEQQKDADAKLEKYGPDVNLPDFIRYASMLISPLLRNTVFKERLAEKYDIVVPPPKKAGSPHRGGDRGDRRGRGRGRGGDRRGRGRGGGGRRGGGYPRQNRRD